jgi:iron complex transport system substrate-binding protein
MPRFFSRFAVCLFAAFVACLAACGPKGGSAVAQGAGAAFPLTFVDDGARTIVVKEKPVTLVSLAPSVTQMVCALGRANMLRGVTVWCDDPAAAGVEKIGNMTTPDLERIIALHPDLVLGTEMTPRHVYDTLTAAGITCAMFKHNGLTDVMKDMRSIADLIGEDALGRRTTAAMEARRQAIFASVPKGAPVKVALLYDLDSMGSAGRGSWVDDMLRSINLDNIANRAKSSWPRLSKEALIIEQPKFIIMPLPADAKEAEALRARLDGMKTDPVYGGVGAIKTGRVILIPADLINIPGPTMLEAMQCISGAVYGGAR